MTKSLLAIAPNDLSKAWPEIREDVASVEAPDGFIPEDVFAMCRQGAAALFFMFVDGKRVGYMVLRQVGTDLHIWQVKADNGYDVLTQFRPELMAVARGANCNKLTYGSTRGAWAKVSQKHGFKMRMVVYECGVEGQEAADNTGDDGAPDADAHATH
jgi:hypothetical protein